MNLVPRFFGGKTAIILVLGIAVWQLSSAARAGLIMDISVNGGAPITVLDNGPFDSDPSPNEISYNTPISGFAASLINASTNNPGSSTVGQISDTASVFENTSAAPETVVLTLSDSGFTPGSSLPGTLTSYLAATLVSAGPGDFVSLASSAGTTTTPTQTLTVDGNETEVVPFSNAGTYSLQSVMTFQLSPGASAALSSSTTTVVPVPEPSTVSLLAAIMAFAAFARFWRHRVRDVSNLG